jgi:hypothetical protein
MTKMTEQPESQNNRGATGKPERPVRWKDRK